MALAVARPLYPNARTLPEPWSPSDGMVPNALDWKSQFSLPDPRFLLDYENHPAVIPDALQSGHVRPSVATRWDSNGNLVEDTSGTLRLQRDPATQAVLGLLYEPKRTQILGSPMDVTSGDWLEGGISSTNADVGTAKGQPYDEIVENSNNSTHQLTNQLTRQTEGSPYAISTIVKANGRNWISLSSRANDDGASFNVYVQAWFDLGNGVTGSTNLTSADASFIEHAIDDLGGGWYRCKMVVNPDSTFALNRMKIRLANGDGVTDYTGDGSSGIYVMHAQAEVSREVTSPILSGGAVREADEVDYRFDFPDVTTGVAFSVEQQAGDDYQGSDAAGHVTNAYLGMTSRINKGGVFVYNDGVLGNSRSDGWYTKTRNSNEDPNQFFPVEEETIDRLRVGYPGTAPSDGASFIIRQIAIWTQTLTSTQKTDLANNYLTQP